MTKAPHQEETVGQTCVLPCARFITPSESQVRPVPFNRATDPEPSQPHRLTANKRGGALARYWGAAPSRATAVHSAILTTLHVSRISCELQQRRVYVSRRRHRIGSAAPAGAQPGHKQKNVCLLQFLCLCCRCVCISLVFCF